MTSQSDRKTEVPVLDRLDVFDDVQPHGAAFNMALDEVLLARLQTTPLLRVYRWERPAVSFGYFTPWRPVADHYPGRDLVRRWTGGGVVEHGDDLTYSMLLPRSHPLSNGPAGHPYRAIHEALRSALQRLGWAEADLAETADPPTGLAAEACFARPVRHDLLSGGRKISGAAQRRTQAGLLHQGSVRPDGVVAPSATALASALAPACAREHGSLTVPAEALSAARRLAEVKYATVGWLRRV